MFITMAILAAVEDIGLSYLWETIVSFLILYDVLLANMVIWWYIEKTKQAMLGDNEAA
ncbi:hypothetical protein [Salibacterium salarium]|nr:hypothetical protein [Salibacterium salarium]